MDGKRFIQSIRLQNILSYGPETPPFDLEPLNVLIGPNASGKSNLIEALSILAAAPRDIQEPFRQGGGVQEWIWKGTEDSDLTASIEVTVGGWSSKMPPTYRISFTDTRARFIIHDEVVEATHLDFPDSSHTLFYGYRDGYWPISEDDLALFDEFPGRFEINDDQSILSQRRDPRSYPELSYVASLFESMRFYRDFPLGRNAPVRLPQQADLPQDHLTEDASNLAVVLSYLQNQQKARKQIQHHMQDFYPLVSHIHPRVLGGTVQLFFEEESLHKNVPATRLSDGSLRYLCLLVALYNPSPSSVICIEEPEMGLHPDIIPKLAKLLVEASKRSQIIVTTHSDVLVDALSDTPEAIVICEKESGSTQLRRLDPDELNIWLEEYRLGELWTSGELGGNIY